MKYGTYVLRVLNISVYLYYQYLYILALCCYRLCVFIIVYGLSLGVANLSEIKLAVEISFGNETKFCHGGPFLFIYLKFVVIK